MKSMNVISSKVFFSHITGDSCLESPKRLGLLPLEFFKEEDLERYKGYEYLLDYAHTHYYTQYVKQRCKRIEDKDAVIPIYYDGGTLLCRDSYKVACFAAGYAVESMENSLRGNPTFAVVRPPGHHAEPDIGKGFCIFNNMAIAAQFASTEYGKRVFIIDFDVHRGDGTQEIIKDNKRIYHFSINQENIYPDGLSVSPLNSFNIKNVYLPQNASEEVYLENILNELKKSVDSFGPDVIGFSAGFDSCSLDKGWLDQPDLDMGEEYYRSFRRFAENSGLPYFAVLEGGYNPESVELGLRAFTSFQ